MSRRAITSLMTMLLLAAFAFASTMQPNRSQSEPTQQEKTQPAPAKQEKAQPAPTKQDPALNPMPSAPVQDTAQSTTTINSDDSAFLKDAAHDGVMEVQIGRLAVDKATDPEIKQFAQRLIDDHSKANQDLTALASQKGVSLPAMSDTATISPGSQSTDQATATSEAMEKPNPTDTSATKERHARVDTDAMLKDEKDLSKLSGLSGDAFDRAFIEMQVKGHERDVKEFEKVSKQAKDPDVRAFAANTLPTLQGHLTTARQIQDRMKSNKK